MKKITIIVVNYNGWQDTVDCLKSIDKLQIINYKLQIVLVDNASNDNSVVELKEWIFKENKSNIELVELSSNKGFSGGNNVGIKQAMHNKSDYILLLNNDTVADPKLVSKLINRVERDSSIGIVGPKIYFEKGYEYHKNRYKQSELGNVIWFAGGKIDWNNMYAMHRGVDEVDRGQYDKSCETDFITGCSMFIKREVVEEVGYFDNDLFLYLEDLDYCIRAKKAGYNLIYEPASIIWHKNASSSDKPGSKLHQYYQTRNRLIVGMRYAPFRTRLALVKESIRQLMKSGITRKAVVDYYLYNWGRWKD